MGRNADAPRLGGAGSTFFAGAGVGVELAGVVTGRDTTGVVTGLRVGVPGWGFGLRHLHTLTLRYGAVMRSTVEPHIVFALRDIYRLSAFDVDAAVAWFSRVCRDGYHPDIHRQVILDIEAHQKKGKG